MLHHTWAQVPCILGKVRRSRQTWTKLYGTPGKWLVLHYCNDLLCREPRHLYLGTPADNARDREEAVSGPSVDPHPTFVVDLTAINRRRFQDPAARVAVTAGMEAARLRRGLAVHPRCTTCNKSLRPRLRYYQVDGAIYHSHCPHPPEATPSVYQPEPPCIEVAVDS